QATDPIGYTYGQYQAVASAGNYAGKLSADPCERQRALKALEDYFSTPEAYANAAVFIDSLLAGGVFGPEAAVGGLEAGAGVALATRTETQLEFAFTRGDLSGALTEWDLGA